MYISGGDTFTIDLWGDASDPVLQALHFFTTVGCMISFQIAKPFLADRLPTGTSWFVTNTTEQSNTNAMDTVTSSLKNITNMPTNFQSDVENVYFIVGACCIVGTLLLLVSWLCSSCKLNHSLQGQTKDQSGQRSRSQARSKCYLLVTSLILCFISFLGFANEQTFSAFGILFTVNFLDWTTDDGSNLVTVFLASTLVCRCMSIVFAKFIKVNKLLIASTFIALLGTVLMTSLIKLTPFSLWIGACIFGLGNGNSVANSLNAGKRLTKQTGIISSLILTSAYIGEIMAPQVVGYLFDNVDPMWFLYLGVVYSGSMLLLSIVFQIIQFCTGEKKGVVPECVVPLEKVEIPDS